MFDDRWQAARATSVTMRDAVALESRLLPDGKVALPGTDPDPAATWHLQVLGCTPHRVILERQSDPHREPLPGWILLY